MAIVPKLILTVVLALAIAQANPPRYTLQSKTNVFLGSTIAPGGSSEHWENAGV